MLLLCAVWCITLSCCCAACSVSSADEGALERFREALTESDEQLARQIVPAALAGNIRSHAAGRAGYDAGAAWEGARGLVRIRTADRRVRTAFLVRYVAVRPSLVIATSVTVTVATVLYDCGIVASCQCRRRDLFGNRCQCARLLFLLSPCRKGAHLIWRAWFGGMHGAFAASE
eukprot:COSAG06_NODE_3272_length_5581_cov_19.995987_2_plen_174_part_00